MSKKQIWTSQEDYMLKMLVLEPKYSNNWSILSEKMNEEFPTKSRSAKQCRDRYVNYVSISDNNHSGNNWTQQQTEALFSLFQMWGSRWTKISQQIKGKSQNCVKNRFYGSLRKALRKMNRAAKNLVKKFKKEVKYDSITRIIDAAEGLFRLQSPLKEESEALSKKILDLAKNAQEEMSSEEAEQLIVEINKFNMATRSYKSKKKIKNSGDSKNLSKKSALVKKQTYDSDHEDYQEQNAGEEYEQMEGDQAPIQILEKSMDEDFIKIEDGLIDYSQEWAKIHRPNQVSFEDLLSSFQSPLEYEALL